MLARVWRLYLEAHLTCGQLGFGRPFPPSSAPAAVASPLDSTVPILPLLSPHKNDSSTDEEHR